MIDVLEDDSTSGAPRVLMDQPGPQNLIVVDWSAATRQGSQRFRNEDSWGQLGPVFAVADGMGGLAEGHQASAIATRSTVSAWLRADDVNPMQIVRDVNGEVRRALESTDSDGGSTLSALRIAHDQATVVHVGDSRVYRVRRGNAELLTRGHNLRSELLAAGIIPKSAQPFGPLQALTSYLGLSDDELQIDVRSIALRAGDRLVLCTDGVFEEMRHSQFVDLTVGDGQLDAAAAAQGLTAHASRDDATAMVVDIGTALEGLST